ncbi:cadherin-like domain-containing protein, partial [Wohlfahrtiimonas chitiniclastica]
DVTDKDGDDLTYQVGELPKNGTVVVNEDGTYTYTPNPDYHGEDQFTVVVSDGHGGETIVTVPVTITPVNDAPEAKETNQPIETPEDEPKHGKITDVMDKDGDELTYTLGEMPTHGTVVVNEDGTYTYTPNPDYHGEDQFTVVVSDDHGGETIVTVPVTITPVNDAPEVKEANQPIETPEDEPKHGKITDVTDKDGDDLTYQVGELPKNGTVVVNEDGTYTYTPNPDYHGEDQFTVVVSDGHGGETIVTVPVTITPVNDAPEAKETNQPIETPEDEPKHGKITDVMDKDGDDLTYQVGELPKNGTVVVNEDGT